MKDKDKKKKPKDKTNEKAKNKKQKNPNAFYIQIVENSKKKITFPEWIFLKMIVAMPSYISTSGRTV